MEKILIQEDAEPVSFYFAQKYLPYANIGKGYWAKPFVLGGIGPYTWETNGNIPEGLEISTDGLITGIPKEFGTSIIFVRITDSTGHYSSLRFKFEVLDRKNKNVASDNIKIINLKDSHITYTYTQYQQSFKNPLRGMRSYSGASRNHPWASLGRQYIEWNLIERSESDTVERIKQITDELIGDLPSMNIKIIPRVYLAWPPDKKYWPADLKPGDYTSKAFKSRVFRLISRLGEVWDNDPLIAYIEMGIIGDWGEHHHPWFSSSGVASQTFSSAFEKELGKAFTRAFRNKLIMNRYPMNFTGFKFGIHWDVFGSYEGRGRGNSSNSMYEDLAIPRLADRWKIAPLGGEIDPTFLDEPNWEEASQQNIVRKHYTRLIKIIEDLHWNHLAVLERIDPNDEELWEKSSLVEKALGYRFVIEKATFNNSINPGNTLHLEVSINNAGSSPFYYNWPLEVSILDPVMHYPVSKEIVENIDIRKWLPENTENINIIIKIPSTISMGRYIIALAILDPAGMVPAVRFANINNYGSSPF